MRLNAQQRTLAWVGAAFALCSFTALVLRSTTTGTHTTTRRVHLAGGEEEDEARIRGLGGGDSGGGGGGREGGRGLSEAALKKIADREARLEDFDRQLRSLIARAKTVLSRQAKAEAVLPSSAATSTEAAAAEASRTVLQHIQSVLATSAASSSSSDSAGAGGNLRWAIEAIARRVGQWAAGTIRENCRTCEECTEVHVLAGGPCTRRELDAKVAGGARGSQCKTEQCLAPLPLTGPRSKLEERARRTRMGAGRGGERPVCVGGSEPGRWISYEEWDPDTCRYRNTSELDFAGCLHGKWVLFVGDSTSMFLAGEMARLAGVQRTEISDTWRNATAMAEVLRPLGAPGRRRQRTLPVVSFLFRAKMFRQRRPKPLEDPERDVNNGFFARYQHANPRSPPRRPDAVVMGVGIHEVVGWSGRPPPDLDPQAFRNDTRDLLRLLKQSGFHPRAPGAGRLIWWKAHHLWPGKLQGEAYYDAQQSHKEFQEFALSQFERQGYETADFYQTTRDCYEEVYGSDGVHYRGHAGALHATILANMLCAPEQQKRS